MSPKFAHPIRMAVEAAAKHRIKRFADGKRCGQG